MRSKEGDSLRSLLDFVEFTHLFQQVKRIVLVNGEERWENDAEHSYQLSLTAWYLVEHNKLNLDLNKIVLLALVHDLPEAYAGDTYIFDEQTVLDGKQKREAEAVQLLKKNFPDFSSLHELMAEYEARKTPESRFIYALDKLLPVLNIYLDRGRTWQKKGITLEQLFQAKNDKISISSDLFPYWKELAAILRQNKQLFSGSV